MNIDKGIFTLFNLGYVTFQLNIVCFLPADTEMKGKVNY